MNRTIINNGFGKDVSARRISRILAIQGVYSYLYAREKNSEIIETFFHAASKKEHEGLK